MGITLETLFVPWASSEYLQSNLHESCSLTRGGILKMRKLSSQAQGYPGVSDKSTEGGFVGVQEREGFQGNTVGL